MFIDAMTELCCSALLSSCQTCGVMTHENEKDWLELGVLQLLLQMLSELYIILAICADVSKWGISTPLHARKMISASLKQMSMEMEETVNCKPKLCGLCQVKK